MEKLMKTNKRSKGFTLVEILVAATIIGILVVFATNSYRSGVAETRWEQAKANTDRLAVAVQRFNMDYPSVHFTPQAMYNTTACAGVYPSSQISIPAACLIPLGYLDASDWSNEYFSYYVCDQVSSAPCNKTLDSRKPLACVNVKSGAKVPGKYLSYVYCFFARNGGQEYTS